MWPFDASNNQNEQDMAKALDHLAESGVKIAQGLAKPGSSAATGAAHGGGLGEDHRTQHTPKRKSASGKKKARVGTSAVSTKSGPIPDGGSRPAWIIRDHVTKKGVSGKIVEVWPFSAFIPDGDSVRYHAMIAAMRVIRSTECQKIIDAYASE